MTHLLVFQDAPNELKAENRFGGKPLGPTDKTFDWPKCAECEDPMQFLGHLVISSAGDPKLIAFFMCLDGGVCSTWEAESGANRALIFPSAGLSLIGPPVAAKETLREGVYGAKVVECEGDYDQSRSTWTKSQGVRGRMVLGHLSGTPSWIQSDETPACRCGKKMEFVAQLEEGPDAKTAMNFGGGCAYLFWCADHEAKFLWQQ